MWSVMALYFPRLAFRRCAAPVVRQYASDDQAARILPESREIQRTMAPTRPRHSLGTDLLIRLMEWDCALYRAALQNDVAEADAKKMVENTNWRIFRPLTRVSFVLSRIRGRHPLPRVKWMMDVMFRILFTKPFKREVISAPDTVGFNVTACPLAAYFREQGLPELTPWAACTQDYHMARIWGVRLTRPQTIAAGDPICDFQYSVPVENITGRSTNHDS